MDDLAAEKDLLERCTHGDREAYARLYTQHLTALSRYIYLFLRSRENTEELVQDVFVKIWERKDLLAAVQSFKPYLFKTAKNLLLDQIRRQQTENQILALVGPTSEESKEQPDTDLIYSQYYQIAQDAIRQLPEKRKQIFELRTKDGLSLDEIAQKLAISKTVVKKQFYAATDFVRDYLRKHGEMTIDLVIFISFFLPLR